MVKKQNLLEIINPLSTVKGETIHPLDEDDYDTVYVEEGDGL